MKFEVEYFINLSTDQSEKSHLRKTNQMRLIVDAFTKDSAINKAFKILAKKYEKYSSSMIRIISAKHL